MDTRISQLRVYRPRRDRAWSWAIDYAGGGALGGHGFADADQALADLLATLHDQCRAGGRTDSTIVPGGGVKSLAGGNPR